MISPGTLEGPAVRPAGSAGAEPASPGRNGRLVRIATLVLVGFLVVFPKGGIKLGGVPVTWGYLALALATVPFLLQLAFGARVRLLPSRLWVAGALVPFQAVIWLALLLNGTSGMGFAISLVVTFFVVPLIFLLALGVHLDRIDLRPLFRLLRGSVLFVAAYGIFLFVYKLKTGSFLEIPYLTVNAGDVGGLEDKFIDRGGVFKLISTYNNGNIYGVSLLLLLPLYSWLERSAVRMGIVKLSLLLTLSRTVWAGLIVYELVQRVYVRRISFRALALLGGSLVVLVLAIGYALSLLGFESSFLFDRNLGGRIGQLDALERAGPFPNTTFEAIGEMVYVSVLDNFGVLGLAAFLTAMTAPLALQLLRATPFAGTPYKRSLGAGLMVYLVVAMSDGAILFIPVMAFYWFVVSLLLSPNPSFQGWDPARRPAPGARRAAPRLEVVAAGSSTDR